jgi:AcrR family transcriptional regulator
MSPAAASRLPTRQRHDQIVTAAARLFARHGFSGVGIDDIGAELGMSGPALYRHIEGKEPLLAEIIIGFVDDLAAMSRRCVVGGGEPAQILQRLIAAAADRGLDQSAEITVTLRSAWYVGPGSAADILAHWGQVTGIWIPVLRQVYPGLQKQDAGLYLRATGGLLAGLAQRGVSVPRNRLVEMITAMVPAMLGRPLTARPASHLTPQPPAGDGAPAATSWERRSRREQILDAALALFRDRGFRGVSMREIGDAVGISASALYRHFGSKEDILATAIARVGERVTAGLTDALSAATSAPDALDALLRSYIAICVRNHDLIAVAASEAHHLSPERREQRRANQRLFISEWVHCLSSVRPDLSPAEAKALVSGIVGLVTEAARSRRMERRPDLAEDLYRLAHAVIYAR